MIVGDWITASEWMSPSETRVITGKIVEISEDCNEVFLEDGESIWIADIVELRTLGKVENRAVKNPSNIGVPEPIKIR